MVVSTLACPIKVWTVRMGSRAWGLGDSAKGLEYPRTEVDLENANHEKHDDPRKNKEFQWRLNSPAG